MSSRLTATTSYDLGYPFPDGKVWAAIRDRAVVNMIYMRHEDKAISFNVFRERSRAALSREGAVWSGAIKDGRFVPEFESTDRRHAG